MKGKIALLSCLVLTMLTMLMACSPQKDASKHEAPKAETHERKPDEPKKEAALGQGEKKDPYQATQKELSGESLFTEQKLREINEERKKEGLKEWNSMEEIALELLNKERASQGEKEFQSFQELYDFSPVVKEEKLTREEFEDYVAMFLAEIFAKVPPRIEPSMETIMIRALLDNDPSPSTIVEARNQWAKEHGERADYENLRAIYEEKPHEGLSFGSILAHNQMSWALEHKDEKK